MSSQNSQNSYNSNNQDNSSNFSQHFNNVFVPFEGLPPANVIEPANIFIHENGNIVFNDFPSEPDATFDNSLYQNSSNHVNPQNLETITESESEEESEYSDETNEESEESAQSEDPEAEVSGEDLDEDEDYHLDDIIHQYNFEAQIPNGYKRRFRYSRDDIHAFITSRPYLTNPVTLDRVYYIAEHFATFIERLTAFDVIHGNFPPNDMDQEIEFGIYQFDRRMFLRNLYFTKVDRTLLMEKFTTQPQQQHIVDDATSQDWIAIKGEFFNMAAEDSVFVSLNDHVAMNQFTVREMIREYLINSNGF